MALLNLGVQRAIINRQTAMTVETSTATLIDGLFEENTPVIVQAKGCFQQITRFDSYFSHELKQMAEGERLEATNVLWTLYPVQRGRGDLSTSDTITKADIVTDALDGTKYKVLYVREKYYGQFYRATLVQIDDR